MFLKKLKIKNVRSIEEAEVTFIDSNYVTGFNKDTNDGNGCGKTSLMDSIKINAYGTKSVDINIKKFVRKGAKSAEIDGMWQVGNDIIEIQRSIKKSGTSTLKVLINGKDSECKTATDYQNEIYKYLDTPEEFKKFRLIDKDKGTNILDFTPGNLRKTLMALCEDRFDDIRKKLTKKQSEYEKYNKDAVLYKLAPSESRLEVLTSAIKNLDTSKLKKITDKIREFQNEKYKLTNSRGQSSKVREIKDRQIYKLKNMNKCPSCFQEVKAEYKAQILEQLNVELKNAVTEIQQINEQLSMYDDIVNVESKKQTEIYKRKDVLNKLKYKLETRISQKDYRFTKSDVELVKKAIAEIDNFANYYILKWVKVVQPIVNSCIAKLNMVINFEPDKKGNLEIIVHRGKETFCYDELSGGERLFISFIFKIAILLEQQKSGLMLSDEGFSCLSTENIHRAINVAEDLPVQLIFVSHNPELDVAQTKTIYLEKENDVSILRRKS